MDASICGHELLCGFHGYSDEHAMAVTPMTLTIATQSVGIATLADINIIITLFTVSAVLLCW